MRPLRLSALRRVTVVKWISSYQPHFSCEPSAHELVCLVNERCK